MAHFAKLDENNIVLEVNVVNNEILDSENEEVLGIAFLTEWSGGHTNWKQTSYNNNFRKQYAGIGFTYDPHKDVFIAPQPYPLWILDNNFDWQPPTPKPNGENWVWVEENLEWQQLGN
jgi:hypothetical protein